MKTLRLSIATPNGVVVDEPSAASVRVRDHSGSLGVLPGHADLVSVLPPSVVHWTVAGTPDRSGGSSRCSAAIAGGVVRVTGGCEVRIACREALAGDAVDELGEAVRAWRASEREADRDVHAEDSRLHAAVLRRIGDARAPRGPVLP